MRRWTDVKTIQYVLTLVIAGQGLILAIVGTFVERGLFVVVGLGWMVVFVVLAFYRLTKDEEK
jgi:uncharacterized membrane protein